MRRKGQINQVFVWIIIALVIGATALFGVRSIGGLLEDKCSIDVIKFEEDIREAIILNNDYGGINLEAFYSPCDYTHVCFVDGRVYETQGGQQTAPINPEMSTLYTSEIGPFFQILLNNAEDGVQENVYLFNDDGPEPVGFVPQVRISLEAGVHPNDITRTNGFEVLCVPERSGRFTMVMEGLGRNTWIKPEP